MATAIPMACFLCVYNVSTFAVLYMAVSPRVFLGIDGLFWRSDKLVIIPSFTLKGRFQVCGEKIRGVRYCCTTRTGKVNMMVVMMLGETIE